MSTRAIIFSRDRPLQLDACLRSLRLHCRDLDAIEVHVLYTASDEYAAAYVDGVMADQQWAWWTSDHGHFEENVRHELANCAHVLFIVDDSIFVRSFSVREMVTELTKRPDAIGLSLRLGLNCVTSYPGGGASQKAPQIDGTAHEPFCSFKWPGADGDWGYPLEVSSSLYRTADVERALFLSKFRNPNEMEHALACSAFADPDAMGCPRLLCAPLSLAFSVPANKVQTTFANRAGTDPRLSADALLRLWQEGWRIDVAALAGYTPSACHEEIALPLMKAGGQ